MEKKTEETILKENWNKIWKYNKINNLYNKNKYN